MSYKIWGHIITNSCVQTLCFLLIMLVKYASLLDLQNQVFLNTNKKVQEKF